MRLTGCAIVLALAVGCGKSEAPADTTAASVDADKAGEPATKGAAPDAAEPTAQADVAAVPDTAPAPAADAAPAPTAAARYFKGKVELPGDMVLTLHVTLQGEGGTLDIPLQRVEKAPLTEVKATAEEVAFAFRPQGAPEEVLVRFSAKKEATGDAFVGELDQMGMKLPLRLEPVAGAGDFVARRPQTPTPPLPYKTEQVTVEVDGATLACTLSQPEVGGPHPAVVFFTGSGPQDRDETIFEHKPFLVISNALVPRGVATLRCDDRGVGESTGSLEQADIGTFVKDGQALVAFLRARPDIDKTRIGAFGHSEGGIVVSELAKSGDVAFVAMLAGPALSGRAVLVRQNLDLLRNEGVPAEKSGPVEKAVDGLFGAIVEGLPEAELKVRAKAIAEAFAAVRKEGEAAPPEAIEQMTASFIELTKSPWLKSFLASAPAEKLAASPVPVLALYGDKDTQVPGADHAVALNAAFAKAKKENAEVEVIAGANHLFQQAETGRLSEYEEIEETIAPSVLERLVAWLAKQGGKQ